MTRDEILKMEAGRELDALVAEHVMGWTKVRRVYNGALGFHQWRGRYPGQPEYEAHERIIGLYSTYIAAAWIVLEEIVVPVSETDPEKQAIKSRFTEWFDTTCIWAHNSKDAAYVICIGVLLAKMELDDD